jgi:hypothetical protein
MTMYLPNPDVQPAGSEPVEFLDIPATAPEVTSQTRAAIERREEATVQLSEQTRSDITRWAQEYISGLVENHHGDREDVRSVIHDLHDQSTFTDHDRGW